MNGRGCASSAPGELAAFLRSAAADAFAPGRRDCGLWLADWHAHLTGIDPAAHLRGRYRTRLGFLRIVRRAGGMVRLVGGIAEGAGWRRLGEDEPARLGDIGVVDVPTGPTGAIRGAGRWLALALAVGIIAGQPPRLAAWRLEGC